jgi:hypothetical protein
MRHPLQWIEEDGVWIARASRTCGGKYRISTRPQPDGSGDLVFDVVRLVPSGSGTYRPSFLGAGASLDAAKAIAGANHARLKTLHRRVG